MKEFDHITSPGEDLQARIARIRTIASGRPLVESSVNGTEEQPKASTIKPELGETPDSGITLQGILEAPEDPHESIGYKRQEKPLMSFAEAMDLAARRLKN